MYSGVSVRRLAVLATQLPPGARVWQAEGGEPSWANEDYWFAGLVDEVRRLTWEVATWGAERGRKGQPPKPLQRPKDKRAEKVKAVEASKNAARWVASQSSRDTALGVQEGAVADGA